MNEEKTFENRPVTMNPKKNLLEIEEHMYILDDVEKPNVFRNMFPYSDIPKIHGHGSVFKGFFFVHSCCLLFSG